MLPLKDANVPIKLAPDTIVVAITLPPEILAADVMLPVALINPPVKTFPPVMLPLALHQQ